MVKIFDKATDHILNTIDNRHADKDMNRSKPNCIWFSQNNQWNEWVGGIYKYTMKLELEDDLSLYNILYLDMSNHEELLSFINKYKKNGYNFNVDWNKVAKEYDGIFMDNVKKMPSTYYKLYRTDGNWILSLDVDSLCIWRWDETKPFRLYCINP